MYFSHICSCDILLIFFFKQNTAYELLISDWSSDVCSSDLIVHQPDHALRLAAHDGEEAPPGIGILYRRTFKRLDKADQRRQRGAKFMACVGDEIDAHLFARAQGRAIDDAYRLLVVSDGEIGSAHV